MPFDIAALATTVVTTFLIPYVKDKAKEFADSLSEKVSDAAADHVVESAPKLWQRVKDVFTADNDIITLGLLDEFEKDPETWQAPIEKKLKQKLEDDPKLREELNEIVQGPQVGGQSIGAQIVNAVNAGIVDLRGAHISGSGQTIAGVIVNPAPPDPSKKPS